MPTAPKANRAVETGTRVFGLDLAWSERNLTGACVLDGRGVVIDEQLLGSDDEILDWMTPHFSDDHPVMIAIDAPLQVPNETGRHVVGEALVGCQKRVAFWRWHVGWDPQTPGAAENRPGTGSVVCETSGMRPPPDFLPGLNSRKWHGRRIWDPVGFQRVHVLARPLDTDDIQWLVRYLGSHRPADEPWRSQIDTAIAAAKSYKRVKRRLDETDDAFVTRRDASWDQFLGALDVYLLAAQLQHLGDVAAAGASGPEVETKLQQMRDRE